MVLVMENVSDDGILPGDDDDEEEDGELVATPRKGTNDELSDIRLFIHVAQFCLK